MKLVVGSVVGDVETTTRNPQTERQGEQCDAELLFFKAGNIKEEIEEG